MNFKQKKIKIKGFTLVELLVVITITGVFIMTAIPYLSDFIQRSQTDSIVNELSVDLNSARIAAISSSDNLGFKVGYSPSLKNYYWNLNQNSKTIKNKNILNKNIIISYNFNSGELLFSSLGFLQDKHGHNITSAEITLCNILSKNGGKISLNSFGKTSVEDVEC